ncbi:protein FANTASTIC FOUR 4-like [Lycium ferocissimum]|uniref:protein FANTASTIC FOUR 4-like n=1 Tax=Lycium ferocissimum TaxID=112874 RepID=UPI0028158B43|nr:protein FANTASTIC FOUR 4-like [Lycium ferocissimum]
MASEKAEAEAEAESEQNEEVGVHFNEVQSPKGNADNNIGGWSFIQDLSNPKKDYVEKELYIHPLVKRSSNTLSTKSLEMCTESLGSETGSGTNEASIEEHSFFLSETENFSHLARRSKEIVKKHNRIATFPPPLTSISRTNGVQVRPHREGGRLILKATIISARKSYFKTKRVNGRLRLSLLNNTEIETETEAEAQDNEHENVDESDDGSRNLVSENGVGEYIRPSKCKENGSRIKGIPNWEPFWAAIS